MMEEAISSNRIEPRMSVCLKGTAKLLEEIDIDIDIDCDLGPEEVLADTRLIASPDNNNNSDGHCHGVGHGDGDGGSVTSDRSRSRLPKSSILLTGTSYSILGTRSDEIVKNLKKAKLQCIGVRFSESLHIRNHIHVTEITREEKSNAWFRRPEYQAIFKNNTKIISTIGKREKEQKRMTAKKKKEEKKKMKKKRNSFTSFSEDSSVDGMSVATFNTDDVVDDEVELEHVLGIHRDDEQGYSIRGLENETAKRRMMRDQRYMKAKFAVLSIQEDVDEHMFIMQEDYEHQLTTITTKKGRKIIRRFSKTKVKNTEEDENEAVQQKVEALRKEFTAYASAQYHRMISKIAEKYGEICNEPARDAFERGLQDERAVRAIDWIQKEGFEGYTGSIQSSGGKMSDGSPDPLDKRRPSTTSTAATEESAASLALKIQEKKVLRLGRMRRPKIPLWKFKS